MDSTETLTTWTMQLGVKITLTPAWQAYDNIHPRIIADGGSPWDYYIKQLMWNEKIAELLY